MEPLLPPWPLVLREVEVLASTFSSAVICVCGLGFFTCEMTGEDWMIFKIVSNFKMFYITYGTMVLHGLLYLIGKQMQ